MCAARRLVALLAEGVDRNIDLVAEPRGWRVALLAEGVDRNTLRTGSKSKSTRSPSSQRAWIEMTLAITSASLSGVALLAEGVDRN